MRPLCLALPIVAVMLPGQAFACTLCESSQAISIRARLLQPDLWLNLGAILLPLALLASIIAMVAHHPADRAH